MWAGLLNSSLESFEDLSSAFSNFSLFPVIFNLTNAP